MNEIIDFGKNAVFIWSAYGVAAVILGGLLAVSLRGMRRDEAAVKSLRAEIRAGRDEVDE